MKTRLFTFGCSFTNYVWPTWADILAIEYDQYENWGKVGAGNHFIFYSLIEAIARSKISTNDTVAIMWTSVGREDRYIGNKWFTPGLIYNSPYPKTYVDEFTDPTGFFLTNVTVIDAVKKLLDGIGCRYHFFSMIPFEKVEHSNFNLDFSLTKLTESRVKKLYQSTLDTIEPSIFEVVFESDWSSRSGVIIPVAKQRSLDLLQKQYEECAGAGWPKFSDFVAGRIRHVDRQIQIELEEQFQFVSWRDNILSVRQDSHATPSEHAEYLKKLGFGMSKSQEDFAREWNHQVLTDQNFKFTKNKFERF